MKPLFTLIVLASVLMQSCGSESPHSFNSHVSQRGTIKTRTPRHNSELNHHYNTRQYAKYYRDPMK